MPNNENKNKKIKPMKKNLLKPLLFSIFIYANSAICIGQKAELTPLFAFDNAAITSISENGEWACGSAFNNSDNAGYQSNASKWNLKTGERIYLVSDEELDIAQSDAFAISNDGSLVAGQYLHLPAYHLNGQWHTLELTQGYTIGEARGIIITDNDTIIVGRIFDGLGYQKVQSAKWVNGKFESFSDIIPREYQYNEDKKMANQITGISLDGRILLGATDPMCWPARTPFIIKDGEFKLLSINNRPEFVGYNYGADFFKEEKMSHNGKYITFSFFGHNTHIPCVYDVEKDEFRILTEAPAETGGKAVDNIGNVYYAGPITTGIERKSYVTINGKATQVDNILLEKFGITQEQINSTCADQDLTGSIRFIYDVAADGKTIIGSAGYGTGGYNWVLKLDYNLHDEALHAVKIDNNNHKNITSFYVNGYINILNDADYIEIYTTNGQMLLSQQVTTPIIPTSLKQGVYIIALYKNNHKTTNKLVIK